MSRQDTESAVAVLCVAVVLCVAGAWAERYRRKATATYVTLHKLRTSPNWNRNRARPAVVGPMPAGEGQGDNGNDAGGGRKEKEPSRASSWYQKIPLPFARANAGPASSPLPGRDVAEEDESGEEVIVYVAGGENAQAGGAFYEIPLGAQETSSAQGRAAAYGETSLVRSLHEQEKEDNGARGAVAGQKKARPVLRDSTVHLTEMHVPKAAGPVKTNEYGELEVIGGV